jgi:glucose/arabinose dehydrogenase
VAPVATGLDLPVAVDFAPDGTMYVAEQSGVVRVVRDGTVLPQPFIDISADVNSFFEHGLLGMVLHPQFPQVPYVYLLYTHDSPGLTADVRGARVARLERVVANTANPDVAATGAGSRTVILGRNADASLITDPSPTQGSKLTCWRDGARVEDCIPQDSYRHQVGGLAFGPDGALYAANGDVDRLPGGPLDPANLIGTILRLNPTTGAGLADNPFYNGNPNSNISKVWSYGLRNPFRFSLDPATGKLFLGDVGQDQWESIQESPAGFNHGWPCYEAGRHVYGVFQNTALCQAEYADGPRQPLYDWAHTGAGGSAIGGDWYHGTTYPQAYRGGYFFADYSQGWIKYLQPATGGGYAAHDFAADGGTGGTTSGIVQLTSGPNGDLFWVSINNGAVYRLRFTGTPPPPPPQVLALPFNEGSGATAADSTGNGNNATLRNGAGWAAGKQGTALNLDGVDDLASIADAPSLDGFTDEITLAGWVRRPTAQTGWRHVISRQAGTTSADQFYLSFKDGVPFFGLATTNSGNEKTGGGSGGALGEWVHLAGVYDGSKLILYVNGTKRSELAKTGPLVASDRPVLVGANANSTGPLVGAERLKGQLDDVRVYSRALSATEVAGLAQTQAPPQVTITEPGDVSVGVGTTVDFAANAADATDGDLSDEITWRAVMHHNAHTHGDYLPPTTGPTGSFDFDDHGDDTYIELCAKATNSAGVSAEDCVEVRPTTTTVTVNSVPQGRQVTFGESTRTTPFTVEANSGASRTLSAPLLSGCFTFAGWSDGGGATHQITVPATDTAYTVTFTDGCGLAPLLHIPFSEGAGTTAADSSGHGNTATLRNGATWGPGRFGNGLALDGVNDFASISASPALNGFTDRLTVTGWVRRPSSQSSLRHVISRQIGTTSADQFHLGFRDGAPYFSLSTTNGGNQRTGGGAAGIGTWVHLAGVYDGSKLLLYVNGARRSKLAKTGSVTPSTRPLLIGANANGVDPLVVSQSLKGSIDDVRVYPRALSDIEIALLAGL